MSRTPWSRRASRHGRWRSNRCPRTSESFSGCALRAHPVRGSQGLHLNPQAHRDRKRRHRVFWVWLAYPLSAIYLVALVLLFTYGVNCYVLILYHKRGRRRAKPLPRLRPEDPQPLVTVQLPIYNEKYVARRVIEAAGRLRYRADR